MKPKLAVTAVHSSDLHLCGGTDPTDMRALDDVLTAARRLEADLVLLAGDVFDHNRVPLPLIDTVRDMLAGSALPIVILPGNHDCLVADSVYRRGSLPEPDNVHVLGINDEDLFQFPELDLEVWGRPHHSYSDMTPLQPPPARSARWQIAMAHGHWVQGKHDLHRSYLIHDEEIANCTADYIALGHWDRALQIGDGSVPAYYSGSPQLALTVNVVRLTSTGVDVNRVPIK